MPGLKQIPSNFTAFLKLIFEAKLFYNTAGGMILSSNNALDFHPKVLSRFPLKIWKYLKTG